MKISILTPSFNQGTFIEKNIRSVLSQNYPDFEHIVIDGGSTDNTVEILHKYPHVKWVSEPDQGQADALNKGLAMSSGDIIGWINSDDYYDDNIFDDVIMQFENNETQWIIGNITYYYPGFEFKKAIVSPEINYKNLLRNPDIVKQQGVFFRKGVLRKVGGWNKDFYMTMDYDLWVRLSKVSRPKMIDKNFAFFVIHPEQKSSPKNYIRQISDINKILKTNHVFFIFRLPIFLKKYFYFVKSITKRILISTGFIDDKFDNIPLSTIK